MARLLLLALLIFGAVYLRNRFVRTPKPQRKRLLMNWLLWGLVAAVVAMALAGRLHWIGGLLALSVPFIKQAALWFMQRKLNQHGQASASTAETATDTAMDIHQARQLLNLEAPYQKEDVIAAHRKLMQKNHPDQGGSDYLAAMLNQAKDLLLESLDHDN